MHLLMKIIRFFAWKWKILWELKEFGGTQETNIEKFIGELMLSILSRLCIYLGGGDLIWYIWGIQFEWILCIYSIQIVPCVVIGQEEYPFGSWKGGWLVCKFYIWQRRIQASLGENLKLNNNKGFYIAFCKSIL